VEGCGIPPAEATVRLLLATEAGESQGKDALLQVGLDG
jgi:hypothetical protein